MAETEENKKPAAKKPAAKKTTTRKTATTRKASAAKTPAAKKPATRKTAASKASTSKTTSSKSTTTRKPAAAKKPSTKTPKPQVASEQDAPKTAAESVQAEDATASENASRGSESAQDSAVDKDKIMAELKDKDWLEVVFRGLFMVLFGFVASGVLTVTFGLSIIQFIVMILLGEPNALITRFVRGCAKYIEDVLDFLSFRTDDRPFPLGKDLPDGD